MYRYIWFDIVIRMRSFTQFFLKKESTDRLRLDSNNRVNANFFLLGCVKLRIPKFCLIAFWLKPTDQDPNSYRHLVFGILFLSRCKCVNINSVGILGSRISLRTCEVSLERISFVSSL